MLLSNVESINPIKSKMKKIYVQPSMYVGSMNASEMIAGGASWKVVTNSWDGGTGPSLGGDGKPGKGDGGDAAVKHNGFYSSYDDDVEW